MRPGGDDSPERPPARALDPLLPALLAVVAAAVLLPDQVLAQEMPGRQGELDEEEIRELQAEIREVDDRVIIGFKPEEAPAGVREDGTALLSRTEVRPLVERHRPEVIRSVSVRYRIIPAVAARIDPERIRPLLEDPAVDYVEPDYLLRPDGLPHTRRTEGPVPSGIASERPEGTAPRGRDLRGPRVPERVRTESPVQAAQTRPWGVRRIEAPSAWSVTRGDGVDVGIVDTGIDEDHPDLDPVSGINAVTGGTARGDWDDATPRCGSHGTHVAGTVAALDNDRGVVGVAPEVELHAIRVFDPDAAGFTRCLATNSAQITGLQWAAENGIEVINMSLGSRNPSLAVADALTAAYASGVFPVASAGNDDDRVNYPGGHAPEVAVAAVDSSDAVASFSNHGPEVEVSGPGVSVLSTRNDGTTFVISGTSMASPHAAGVAALIRAAAPGLSLDEVRSILRTGAEDLGPAGHDRDTGAGIVRADRAAAAVGGGDLAVTAVPAEARLRAEPGGEPARLDVELRSAGGTGAVSWSASAEEDWLDVSPSSGTVSDGAPATLTIAADPSGRESAVHTAFVSVEGDAVNAPFRIPVRFAVAEEVPVDASTATAGSLLSPEGQTRFVFSGDAGQRVDLAVVPSGSDGSVEPLDDPRLTVYLPDGRTALVRVDDAASEAGLGQGTLVTGLTLPEDGTYEVEVSAGADVPSTQDFPAGFTVLARPAGPVLGMTTVTPPAAREGGAPDETSFEVVNLTGIGSLDWTASSPDGWLGVSPASGTASEDDRSEPVRSPAFNELRRRLWRGETVAGDTVRRAVRSEAERRLGEAPGRNGGRGGSATPGAATTVTVTADPAGFPPGDRTGEVRFSTDRGWLAPFQRQLVPFRVHDAGFEFLPAGAFWSEFDTRDRETAVGLEFAAPTDLRPVSADATVGAPVLTVPFSTGAGAGFLGLEMLDQSGNMLLGQNAGRAPILEADPATGTVSPFARVPGGAVQMDQAPGGEIYVPGLFQDQVYRVAPDGSSVSPVGGLVPGAWAVAFRPADGAVYVAAQGETALVRIDPATGETTPLLSLTDFDPPGPAAFAVPDNLAAGRSGLLYMSDASGRIWRVDPEAPAAEVVAFGPDPDALFGGLGLLEGRVALSGFTRPRGYLFPVSDGAARTAGPSETVVVDVPTGETEATRGGSITVPVEMDLSDAASEPAAFFAELEWNESALSFVEVRAGDFGGSFSPETGETGVGIVRAGAERSDGVADETVDLFEVTFAVPEDAPLGTESPLRAQVTRLEDGAGEDLVPRLDVTDGRLCVGEAAFGDVTGDPAAGEIDVIDAQQIARFTAGLDVSAPGRLQRVGDVSGDGEVTATDAQRVARSAAGLPVPEGSRIGVVGVSEELCP